MSIVTLSNGARFAAERGSTLLDAAAARGVVLEHSCRTGRCGTCKARVLAGVAVPVRDAASLSDAERDAGWLLTCAYEAHADLTLDVEDLGALACIAVKTLPTRVVALRRPAPDVVVLELRLPPGASFRFLPGQYIDLTDPTGVKRSYSLASDAGMPQRLELHVRRVDGGQFSGWCFEQAAANDLLRFRGPHGTFFLRPVGGLHVVFLATGTGIAPILSMLAQLASLPVGERPASVALYWGGRTPADLYLDPLAHRLALPAARYVPVLSRADAEWSGARGHVQDVLLRQSTLDADTVVYACGSPAMIGDAQRSLLAAGLSPKRFFADAFVSSN